MDARLVASSLDAELGPSLQEVMGKVKFSVEQMSRICGVSRRQLSYWTKKGILTGDGGYSLSTLAKVMLIKKELDKRTSLRRAVQKVDEHLGRRAAEARELEVMSDSELRALVVDRLSQVQGRLRQIRLGVHQAGTGTNLRRLASELSALQVESLLKEPQAGVTLPSLASRLKLALEQLERILQPLEGQAAPRA